MYLNPRAHVMADMLQRVSKLEDKTGDPVKGWDAVAGDEVGGQQSGPRYRRIHQMIDDGLLVDERGEGERDMKLRITSRGREELAAFRKYHRDRARKLREKAKKRATRDQESVS